ncbi:YqaI family protein [Peribacillus butanolivorans]|uniref:YqaI family protein n=1 Tax=Peribacillus butanolivorans TaxID=421767 RepID=UPI0036C38503
MPKKDSEHSETSYSNLVAQTEQGGIDYFGNEILVGDVIIIDKNNGEVFLENSLEDYLIEVLCFQFTTAE